MIDMQVRIASSIPKVSLSQWRWLFIITLIYLCQAMWHFGKPTAPDAAMVYLPFAKEVLKQGIGFFLQPKSIDVSPLAYLWPALFGGELSAIKCANLVAGVLMVLLTFGIGRQLHSPTAGLVAALMFAISPFLVRWIPTALSEPPFFLFTLAWLWGTGEVIAGKKWAIPIAAIALSLSILSRGIWLYPTIILSAAALLLMIYKPAARQTASYVAATLVLGLVIPMLVIIKNMVLFGVPTIESGSGAALFLGAHIITNGFEPPLLGLAYEGGSNGFHSALGNREHAAVAIQFLKERSLFELFDWYLTKISWVTLFSSLEAPIFVSVWRVLELAFAFTGVWWAIKRKNIFVLLLGAGVVLQILQTAFALYNIRYSTDGLELLLAPLAALGLVVSLRIGEVHGICEMARGESFWGLYKYGLAAVAMAAILFMALYFRSVPIINLPSHIPVSILYENAHVMTEEPISVSGEGKTASTFRVALDVPKQVLPRGVGSAIWEVKMSVRSRADGGCGESSAQFQPSDLVAPSLPRSAEAIEEFAPQTRVSRWLSIGKSWFRSTQNRSTESGKVYFNVHGDGAVHGYLLGTAVSGAGLFPVESGKLILKFDCSPSTKVVVDQVSLIAPHFIETYFKSSPVN